MRDTIIIGGGIMGLLCARALAAAGQRVLVLDTPRRHPGASWAGGGILMPLFPWRQPAAVTELCRDALPAYERLAEAIIDAGGPDPQVRRCGMLVRAPGEEEQALAWGEANGIRIEPAAAPGAAGEPSWLALPDAGQVRNSRLLDGVRHLVAREPGISLREEGVRSIEADRGGWRVRTGTGVRSAPRVLVTAGAWSRALLAPFTPELPLMPVKGEMLRYPPGTAAPDQILLSASGYLIPRADGSVLAGSTLEEDVDDMRPTRAAARTLEKAVAELWPPLRDTSPVLQWTGLRPGARRSTPLIGPVPACAGLYVATGHYRYGLTAAPATADLISACMNGAPARMDPTPYRPDP